MYGWDIYGIDYFKNPKQRIQQKNPIQINQNTCKSQTIKRNECDKLKC